MTKICLIGVFYTIYGRVMGESKPLDSRFGVKVLLSQKMAIWMPEHIPLLG
jgi:hypothetical protein